MKLFVWDSWTGILLSMIASCCRAWGPASAPVSWSRSALSVRMKPAIVLILTPVACSMSPARGIVGGTPTCSSKGKERPSRVCQGFPDALHSGSQSKQQRP